MPASIPLTLTTTAVLRMQGFIDGHQHGASQMIAVGTNLYFVMRDQIGASPDNVLTVWKSTDKITWVQVAQLPAVPFQTNAVSRDCPAVLVGSVIYVLDVMPLVPNVFPANNQYLFHRFDTGSDTFLSDGAFTGVNTTSPGGSGTADQLYACAVFNNGTILVTYSITQNVAATNQMVFQIYTPGSDSWGADSVFLSNASNAVQAIHDPVTDLVFVPYITGNLSTVRVVSVTSGLVTTDNAGFTVRSNAAASYPNPAVGVPVITGGGEIIIPYRFIPASGPPILRAVRATVGAAPVFSVETVEDLTTLPVNSLVQQFDQSSAPGWMVQEINGTLYAFYDIDNGDLDDASSQSFLYYRSSQSAGVWDDPLIAFTSAIPGESLMPYGTKITGFDPVILVGVVDPTTYPAIASLTNFILFGAGGAALAASCNNPPDGHPGVAYTHSFSATGGTAPYTWAILSGAFPVGLTMDTSGNVTGKPALVGVFSFTLQVTDAVLATATVTCSITITGVTPATIVGGVPVGVPDTIVQNGIALPGCKRKNQWDWCAYLEGERLKRIHFPDLCTIPKEFRCFFPLPWGSDFGANAIPVGAVPFLRTAGILTPDPTDGDQEVVHLLVPTGYDGLVQGTFWFYTGKGFDQGSGDIIWRVRLNQRYLKDLGNNPYAMGSVQSPMPMTEGQVLLSCQRLSVLVNVPNLSGNIQVNSSNIVAGLVGFFWPRG